MIPSSQRKAIADLLRREVVPAIGCTEPMAVALCTARARELLGGLPERIEVLLSANILKNAMGVGIPGTGMIGLPIAVALGAQIGRSECGLEVLRDVTPEAVARARDYLAADAVSVALKEGISETLYVEVHCTAGGRRAEAVIAGSHTRFVYLACDGEVVLDRRTGASSREEEPCVPLTLRRVFDYALTDWRSSTRRAGSIWLRPNWHWAANTVIRWGGRCAAGGSCTSWATASFPGCWPIPLPRATPVWRVRWCR